MLGDGEYERLMTAGFLVTSVLSCGEKDGAAHSITFKKRKGTEKIRAFYRLRVGLPLGSMGYGESLTG